MDFFEFVATLKDSDGDEYSVDECFDVVGEIAFWLHCSRKSAKSILEKIRARGFEVFARCEELFICRGYSIVYHFEMYGQSYGTPKNPHKYNLLGVWDFKEFLRAPAKEIAKKSKGVKKNVVTVTEIQQKRANQLAYASKLGFDVSWADYHRFFLV